MRRGLGMDGHSFTKNLQMFATECSQMGVVAANMGHTDCQIV